MKDLPDILPHFHRENGFCYPDWDAIERLIGESIPEADWKPAWDEVCRLWVNSLRGELSGDYQTYETPNFLVLTDAPKSVVSHAANTFENGLKQIMWHFDGAASDEGWGKQVVLMFSELEDYYTYISPFYEDGEHPMTGGVCLSSKGFVHFAMFVSDYSSHTSVLIHELTHGCLAHLPLPVWINEALAMRMEDALCGTGGPYFSGEIHDQHTTYWNSETIQFFWSGESWGMPGDTFELSYSLASILWRKIEMGLNPSKENLIKFINLASSDDAGEGACVECFGLKLCDLASDYLGDGDWSPRPEVWH